MFDKEKCKRRVFEKYQEELSKKLIFKRRIKNFLITAVGFVAIGITATLAYNRASIYETNVDKSNTLNPGKIYDGDQTANLTPENKIDQPSKDESKVENVNVVEDTKEEVKYEPTSELCKLLKIIKLEPKNYRINEENCEEFETDKYYYEGLDLNFETIFTKDYYIIGIQNNNLVVTIKNSEEMENIIQNSSLKGNIQVEYNKAYVIDNVNAEDIAKIFYAGYGQDIFEPFVVYLIQKDGTVKGLDIINGCGNGTFIADIVPGLENIERIENMDSREIKGGGARTVVAFANDGTMYELDYAEYNKALANKRYNIY